MNAISDFERKISGKVDIREEARFTLSILNEDMNDKIIRRFKYMNWWYYWNNKAWNKRKEGIFLPALLAHLAASLVQPVISSVEKGISERWVRRARRGYINKSFYFRSII